MEGLIPMLYRAIKRNRVRSRYECLSSASAPTYDVSDFYPTGGRAQAICHFHLTAPLQGSSETGSGDLFADRGMDSGRHRRAHSSLVDYSFGKRIAVEEDVHRLQKQRVNRVRSFRMLSCCLTGA
ncbi:hypothetical protein MLD38_027411 [Melastoma candidum]|uniref:Uncharacterized protein n=1 Tax=Melastoma candidum TaxID=119954 RepID=A0ACB9P317_9MYRT|nr:hypothetical protein MLD38_027411 [Melastoma candidum]